MTRSALLTGVFYNRERLSPYLPRRVVSLLQTSEDRLRAYVPLSTFESQRNAGLSSAAFDLEANIAGDSRAGLDERGAEEVRQIMQARGVT